MQKEREKVLSRPQNVVPLRPLSRVGSINFKPINSLLNIYGNKNQIATSWP